MPDDRRIPPPDRAVVRELRILPPDAEVRLAGELDLHTIAELRAALEAALAAAVTRLVVDLRAVEFASLSALGELVTAAHRIGDRGGTVLLRGARPLHTRVVALLEAPPSLVVDGASGG